MTDWVLLLPFALIIAFVIVCILCEREDQKNREKK